MVLASVAWSLVTDLLIHSFIQRWARMQSWLLQLCVRPGPQIIERRLAAEPQNRNGPNFDDPSYCFHHRKGTSDTAQTSSFFTPL